MERSLKSPNHSIQPTEASRLAHSQFVHPWRLASAADAGR